MTPQEEVTQNYRRVDANEATPSATLCVAIELNRIARVMEKLLEIAVNKLPPAQES